MALLAALFTARAAATSKLGPAMQVFFNFGLISTFFFEEPFAMRPAVCQGTKTGTLTRTLTRTLPMSVCYTHLVLVLIFILRPAVAARAFALTEPL